MTRSAFLPLVLAAALVSGVAGTAAAATATPAKHAPAAKPAARRAAAAAKPDAKAPVAESPESGQRRLDEVRIEGELEVPRVTFITVRKPHRFHDYTRATSVRTARDLAAAATLPSWISPVPIPESEVRKETPK